MHIYLNTFTPLAINKYGKESAKKNNLPLFIDGSCRREPDFENPRPAITQLCRPQKLVTRLKKNDLIIYITKAGKYGTKETHWKLISILEVIDLLPDHNSALAYYEQQKLPVSQNIICEKTVPLPLDHTHGINSNNTSNLDATEVIYQWDRQYKYRAIKYPKVAITQVWNGIINLDNPPAISHAMMQSIFRRIPGTQNPPELEAVEWQNFRTELKL
jgi:hypothetical protein